MPDGYQNIEGRLCATMKFTPLEVAFWTCFPFDFDPDIISWVESLNCQSNDGIAKQQSSSTYCLFQFGPQQTVNLNLTDARRNIGRKGSRLTDWSRCIALPFFHFWLRWCSHIVDKTRFHLVAASKYLGTLSVWFMRLSDASYNRRVKQKLVGQHLTQESHESSYSFPVPTDHQLKHQNYMDTPHLCLSYSKACLSMHILIDGPFTLHPPISITTAIFYMT